MYVMKNIPKKYRTPILTVIAFTALTAIINRFIGLEDIAAFSREIQAQNEMMRLLVPLLFVLVYVLVTATSLPLASILTISAGAIFGTALGSGLVVVGATLGSVIPFLAVKHKLGDSIKMKYPEAANKILNGVHGSESIYLFSIRLAPIFPFYVVNAISGLMKISTFRYMLATALGILPGTVAYVFAGSQIERAIETGSLVGPEVLGGLLALSAVSIGSAQLSKRLKNRKDPMPA